MAFYFFMEDRSGCQQAMLKLALTESAVSFLIDKTSRSASVDTDRGIDLNPKDVCSGLASGFTVETVIERGVPFFVWPDFFQNLAIRIGFF